MTWSKSTASGNGGCVEVSKSFRRIFVRDSKDKKGSVLEFSLEEWAAFLTGVKAGEFD